MDASESPIATPRAQRLADFRMRTLPVIVWCVAAIVCAVALAQRARPFEYIGIAEARQHEISAAVDGVVRQLDVSPLDVVKAGDIVARLDDAALRASVETSRARMRQLAAELDAARLERRANAASLTSELLRFQIDEEQRRLDVLALGGAIEADQIEVERLRLDAQRQAGLMDQGLIGRGEYDNVRLLHEAAQRRLEENRALLAQTERERQAAESRRLSYEGSLPEVFDADPVLRPLREAVIVEGRVVDEIELQRAATVLRSPVAGQVAEVLCRSGQAIVPGEPILTVVEAVPLEVVAWLLESDTRVVLPGSRVRLATRRSPRRTAESVVLRGGETIQAIPARLWRDPRVTEYGRAVAVAAVPALEIAPGEMVSVRFLAP